MGGYRSLRRQESRVTMLWGFKYPRPDQTEQIYTQRYNQHLDWCNHQQAIMGHTTANNHAWYLNKQQLTNNELAV